LKGLYPIPKAWPIIEDDVWRFLVRRFPYEIWNAEEDEEVYIVAMMHLRQNPDYWKLRI
jgi:hypothetical protein